MLWEIHKDIAAFYVAMLLLSLYVPSNGRALCSLSFMVATLHGETPRYDVSIALLSATILSTWIMLRNTALWASFVVSLLSSMQFIAFCTTYFVDITVKTLKWYRVAHLLCMVGVIVALDVLANLDAFVPVPSHAAILASFMVGRLFKRNHGGVLAVSTALAFLVAAMQFAYHREYALMGVSILAAAVGVLVIVEPRERNVSR